MDNFRFFMTFVGLPLIAGFVGGCGFSWLLEKLEGYFKWNRRK